MPKPEFGYGGCPRVTSDAAEGSLGCGPVIGFLLARTQQTGLIPRRPPITRRSSHMCLVCLLQFCLRLLQTSVSVGLEPPDATAATRRRRGGGAAAAPPLWPRGALGAGRGVRFPHRRHASIFVRSRERGGGCGVSHRGNFSWTDPPEAFARQPVSSGTPLVHRSPSTDAPTVSMAGASSTWTRPGAAARPPAATDASPLPPRRQTPRARHSHL